MDTGARGTVTRVPVLVAAALIGVALSGGVLFAFSAFVMPALEDIAPATAVSAMQAINRFAVTPAFMALLFGTALLCVAVLGVAVVRGGDGRGWLIAGALLYLVGVIGVTSARNVPLNDALVGVEAARADAARWAAFADPWTLANHVRTAAAVLAAAALSMGGASGG